MTVPPWYKRQAFLSNSNYKIPGPRRQGIFWLLTIPHASFTPYLPNGISYIKGQLERGGGARPPGSQISAICAAVPVSGEYSANSEEPGPSDAEGFLHWQVVAAFAKKVSLAAVVAVFGPGIHAELTRSTAAITYVWKDSTSIASTRFELG